jgi:hypothetical protein
MAVNRSERAVRDRGRLVRGADNRRNIMRHLVFGSAAIAALGIAGAAVAHPINVPFETRGECEVAFAKSSKLDRERLVDDLGVFETYGKAQRTFKDIFACEYDENQQAWYIVFTGGM